jgi:hypothetical protein
MRRLAACCAVLLSFACAKADNNATTDTTATAAAMPTIALADLAGDWQVRGNNEAGDSVVSYVLHLTADTTGWTITFPGRPALPVHFVSMGGDSVVTHVGPYESALRRGVQVQTNNVFRLRNGELVGRAVAHYAVTTADSVLVINSTGRRVTP